MQCPSCGKTGFVIIGNKRYCSNCGTKLTEQGAPRAISDLKPGQPAAPQVTSTQVAQPSPTPGSVVAPKPANQLHGIQVGSKAPAVLDLRSKNNSSTAPATPSTQPAPVPASTPPVATASPVAPKSVTPSPAPVATTQSMPDPIDSAPKAEPIVPAAPQVQKPIPQPAPFGSPAGVSETQVTPPSDPATSITTTHPKVKRFPDNPALANATPSQNELPNQVATQVDAMKKLATEGDVEPKSEGLKEVLATAKPSSSPGFTQIAAAIAAIGIITGIVWMQNSPKMAFKSAASQAGIEASLPTYMPSSYRQQGNAQVSPGQVTLTYNSPNSQNPLTITQKRTNWDSNSLRENFVSRQADNMLAVQGQGLTIFLYNNTASWVNHGIWYTVKGTDNLSREQILRVAYGL